MFTIFANWGKTKTNEQLKSFNCAVHTKVLTFEKIRKTIVHHLKSWKEWGATLRLIWFCILWRWQGMLLTFYLCAELKMKTINCLEREKKRKLQVLEEIGKDARKLKDISRLWIDRINIVKMTILQNTFTGQCNPNQNPYIFYINRKAFLKFRWNQKDPDRKDHKKSRAIRIILEGLPFQTPRYIVEP